MHDSFGYTVYVAGGVLESLLCKHELAWFWRFCLARAQSFALLLRGVVATAAQAQHRYVRMATLIKLFKTCHLSSNRTGRFPRFIELTLCTVVFHVGVPDR